LLALAIAEGVHQFFELCCSFNLKEDFIVIIGDLDIEVFRWSRRIASRSIGHVLGCNVDGGGFEKGSLLLGKLYLLAPLSAKHGSMNAGKERKLDIQSEANAILTGKVKMVK
jgi:hypothetical protein